MTTSRDPEAVIETVRERVDPDPGERAALDAAVDSLVDRTEAALADLDVEASVLQVGSTARGTWVSGDRDIDVFVQFDPELPRTDLERLGLQVGRDVLPDGHTEFAEHPYVTGEFRGFAVDLVPCYAVPDATQIQSAVDRTPFHNAYLKARLDDELAGAVRLFKQFLKGIGSYGSDLRTEGYSGYIAELLVLEYGGFRETLQAASEWHPPVHLDPAEHGTRSFDDPLVVVDPTDPERNVAAVVSHAHVARLTHYARQFLADPGVDFFFPPATSPMDEDAVRAAIQKRDTTPLAVVFDPPDLVADQLYPQLRRSLAGLVRGLENAGFDVLRGETWARDRAVLFVELSVADLPAIERHEGPPVHAQPHAERFYETYVDSEAIGPFIDGDRYVVERPREITSAEQFVAERLTTVALGAQIEPVLEDEFVLEVGTDVAVLAEAFGSELAAYFHPSP
ncbi:CCA tRNA nucleotidyltransferase [Halodesulfurarchaeum sp. HSR-GB]|uniref:CCA tRNA nucleotidyltransferase n=1 Tax=Halodesulfurarchaeum sp. HSR-GB TaxID=3074077 RepID=UPI002861DA7B|nr:CCA tRNA nucleotidyltransferase [Halodesulfurarchaeum sp. HSR-GB]MDR5656452.1 CCA tRNA nucleotidyltransferase [Halodesulfurarchaeum sp. HSR-GB]